jgi:hypothetical protein
MGLFPFSQFPFSPILEQRLIADLEESLVPEVARLPAAQISVRLVLKGGRRACSPFPPLFSPFP